MPLRHSIHASIVVAVLFVAGCGGARIASRSATFDSLATRQREYAMGDASAAEWRALAEDFAAFAADDPANADGALFGAGIAHFYEGATVEAARAFDRLLANYPDSTHAPNALFWRAKASERLDDRARARRMYQTLANRFPDSAYAAEAWESLTAKTPAETAAAHAPVSTLEEQIESFAPTRPAPSVDALTHELGLTARTIVIDPGHGGNDAGAVVSGRPYEKEIALDVARRLAETLIADGYRVYMTRDDDTFIPLRNRNALARDWEADLFVSLHVNHAENRSARGVETWIAAPSRDEYAARVAARENVGGGTFHDLADYLGELLSSEKSSESRALAEAIQQEVVRATGARDRGVKEAGFVVLLGLRVPSALVELGFVTNAEEAGRLASPDYRERLAEGVAQGVQTYLRRYEATP